jgi:hypothetical protein
MAITPPGKVVSKSPLTKPKPIVKKTAAQLAAEKAAAAAKAKAAAKLREAQKRRAIEAADPYGALVGDDRDAAVALTALFKSYGLDTLAPQIIKMIQNGFSADTIAIELQETKEYKKRFAANERRLKAGLSVLSPAEYISTERAYRQVMSQAGLPVGFYDSTSDFENFLAGDVSPSEVQGRVTAVSEAINKAPAATKDFFGQWYNTGDMIAYALDPKKAQPLIEQRIKAAEAAAIAQQSGFSLSQGNAELIGSQGASLNDIQQGVSFLGAEQATTDKLSAIYGGEDVSQQDLVTEVFAGGAGTARKKLASQERAAFSGSSGQAKGSLNKSSAGSI